MKLVVKRDENGKNVGRDGGRGSVGKKEKEEAENKAEKEDGKWVTQYFI